MSARLLNIAIVILAVLASPVSAQIGTEGLPDLSGLAGAIANAAAPPPPAKGKTFHTSLTVPSVHPGETATGIARLYREGVEKQTGPNEAMRKLEGMMPTMLTGLESGLETRGFAKRDLGVAMGGAFVYNWQMANKVDLSDAATFAAMRTVATAADTKYKARFATLTPAAKEKTYELLVAGTGLTEAFVTAFDKAGKTAEADGMRRAAGATFQQLVGIPAAQVLISPDGVVTDTKAGADAPPPDTTAPPEAAPPAETAPAKKPARSSANGGVKPSQIAGVWSEMEQILGMGGFMSITYVPRLVLKDGTYCEDFDVPPSEFDAAASRRQHPTHWGRWRKGGEHIEILTDKGVWEEASRLGPLSGGGPGQTLNGTYTSLSGGGNTAYGGNTIVAVTKSFTFKPDGHFTTDGNVSASTGGDYSGQGPNVTAQSERHARGTYELGNYSLTLHFDDGIVTRWSYARVSDDMIYLHGASYPNDKSL